MSNFVNFNDIELHKENILSLPKGRSASLLASNLNNTDAHFLSLQKSSLQQSLETVNDNDDDPLDTFVKYITFLQTNYPSDTSKELIKTVETCVRRFKNDLRYKNDPRFLKLWIIVAHQAKSPIDVFKYLSVNKIGTDLSLFYLEYAQLLETHSRNKEALEVYKLGIARKSHPPERLNHAFAEFQKRMACITINQTESQSTSTNDNISKKNIQEKKLSGILKPCRQTCASSSDFKVFKDKINPQLEEHDVLPTASSSNHWENFQDSKEQKKENVREATVWTGAVLSQKSKKQPKAEKINVFKDDDSDSEIKENNVARAKVSLLSEKHVTGSSSSFFKTLDSSILERLDSNSEPKKEIQSNDIKKKQEKLMCDIKSIHNDNKETCIEELRASTALFSKYRSSKSSHPPQTPKVAQVSITKNEQKFAASPTINTKAAMQDVFEMFNQPISSQAWDDEDETISAKVYRPEKTSLSVFKDDDENSEEFQPKKTPKISSFEIFSENNQHSDNSHLATKTPKALPTYPLQSTPFQDAFMGDNLQTNDKGKNARPSMRNFDIMTPITEVSEDRTFAGLDTIYSEKHALSSISGGESTHSSRSFLAQANVNILNDLQNEPKFVEECSEISNDPENHASYESLDIPNPCNPRDPEIIQAILDGVDIPENCGLYQVKDKVSLKKSFEEAICQKDKNAHSEEGYLNFDLSQIGRFKLLGKLGKGSFGSVYLVKKRESDLLSEEMEDDEEMIENYNYTFASKMKSKKEMLMALKIETPAAPWEFYILSLLRSRLSARVNDSIIKPTSCHLFKDESCLLMEYTPQRTLLECVNFSGSGGYAAGTGQSGVDELLAAFWTIEMLRTIESIHASGIIHGDIKPDNFMIRIKDCPSSTDWDSMYQPDGKSGWGSKGISLIDWGSAIDLLSFPEDQRFSIKRNNILPDSSIECWELRNGQSWTYELDWYGCASVAHTLLFGAYMNVSEEPDVANLIPTINLNAHFKRYWQVEMWKGLFDLLLNSGKKNSEMMNQNLNCNESIVETLDPLLNGPGTDFEVLEQEFPVIKKIHDKRIEMETWLQGNCQKGGKSLRNLLKRVEITLMEQEKIV